MGGWLQVSLGILIVVGKSSKNSPKPVLIFWSSIPSVFCLHYTLLKVVSYFDLSVLSVSVMGFQKNGWGCVGVWVCGCVGVWVCGCVGVWVCGWVGGCVGGCVGGWVYGWVLG